MRWFSKPDRRELLLVLFCVCVYLFAFNLENSLSYVGIDPAAAQGTFLRHLGLRSTTLVGKDGRRPVGWRDKLELEIYGDWDWEEGNVAGNPAQRSQGKGSGRHGAQWVQRDAVERVEEDVKVNDSLFRWGRAIPSSKVIKHVPGFTIFDNVFIFNGTVYLVTDDKSDLPPLSSMVDGGGPGFRRWQILTAEEGRTKLGTFGGIIRGVSWMCNHASAYNMTLYDLWRLQSTLDPSIDAEGRTSLLPPQRLIYPHNRFFTDPNPPFERDLIKRQRYDTGLHPYLVKAAFPHLTLQYFEDWDDYFKMAVPFVFERLVLADRKSAAASLQPGQPINSPVFDLEASRFWWEPIRRTLALYFDRLLEEVQEANPKEQQGIFHWRGGPKQVITYIDNQKEGASGRAILAPADYELLMRALRKLARDSGYEFHIVSTSPEETTWEQRMDTIVRSTIILGVHGNHLFDSVWMRPSPRATLMEFFPPEEYVSTREIAVRNIGINYIAFCGSERFFGSSLPKPSSETNHPVNIDTNAVVGAVHDILSKDS